MTTGDRQAMIALAGACARGRLAVSASLLCRRIASPAGLGLAKVASPLMWGEKSEHGEFV